MKKSPSLQEVQDIYNKYKKFIWEEIERETKVKFSIKEIKFEKWERDYWSCNEKEGKILIGNYHKPKSKILTSIIHEAIHLNTSPLRINYKENFLSVEIATCILASTIIKKVNKRFNKKFKMNKFDENYRKYEHRSKEFERIRGNKDFYEFFELIKVKI